MCERLRFFEMTCESLFSLVFLKILGGREHSSKRLKEGNNSSLCSLRERERGKEVKKERKRERRAKQQNSRTHTERVLSAREREREKERENFDFSKPPKNRLE